ncbi:MAG: hypothetical protein JWN52_6881 [Actinomycetia bacterium]|nr:hypothetical protein [Actinomycetes bacterium]
MARRHEVAVLRRHITRPSSESGAANLDVCWKNEDFQWRKSPRVVRGASVARGRSDVEDHYVRDMAADERSQLRAADGLPRGIEDEVRHHMRRAAAERNVVVERDHTPTASGPV